MISKASATNGLFAGAMRQFSRIGLMLSIARDGSRKEREQLPQLAIVIV